MFAHLGGLEISTFGSLVRSHRPLHEHFTETDV
jgi:hypothetical protein